MELEIKSVMGISEKENTGILASLVYVVIFAVGILLLGGALACYGLLIYLKMSKVRSEGVSSEMWKVCLPCTVTGLAVVSLVCFTTSALVALLTDIPVLYRWHHEHISGISTPILLVLYYFIGSSAPAAFVLWVMRELPPSRVANRAEESAIVTFISDGSTGVCNPQRWTTVTSLQNQVSS
ncbi:Tobamovirus multiplication protein 1 [Bienertia sinuspersici]